MKKHLLSLIRNIVFIAALLPAAYSGAQIPSQPDAPTNNLPARLDSLNATLNPCSVEQLKAVMETRQKLMQTYGDFSEKLNYYPSAQKFVEMDNHFLNCGLSLIGSLTDQSNQQTAQLQQQTAQLQQAQQQIAILTEQIAQIEHGQPVIVHEDCTQKIVYITVAAGSLLLALLLMLIKFIRAHKTFQDLAEKIYDKVLDELADKLLVATGIKDDDKLKEKLKKLISLNQSRKNGEMKLDEYFREVNHVLG